MDMVYLVMGTTGEYSGTANWTVRTFEDESEANTFVTKANDWLRERGMLGDEEGITASSRERDAAKAECPFDEYLCISYTGSSYGVFPVTHTPRGALPKAMGK